MAFQGAGTTGYGGMSSLPVGPQNGTRPQWGSGQSYGMGAPAPGGGQAPAAGNHFDAGNIGYGGRASTPVGPQGGPQAPPGEGIGPGFGEQYGKQHVGQYDQPTAFETFAQQQMNGSNPYYDRLRSQGDATINQQMIARGHGNSGGALSALGNYNGALDAAQFQNMGQLLQGAGAQGLTRMGAGQDVANSVQQQQQQRTGQQFGELSDLAHLGAGTVGGFYSQGGQQSGDAAMSGINAGANAAGLTGKGQNAFGDQAWSLLGHYAGGK